MLVDNNVTPDSRVQKQARSAAERGWDVTLLGHKRGTGRSSWKLGKAKVQLVEVGKGLAKQRHLMRGGHLRSPLAYHGRDLAAYRVQQVRARKADLNVRRATARLKGTTPAARSVREPNRSACLLSGCGWQPLGAGSTCGRARRWSCTTVARPWMRLSTAGPPRSGLRRWVIVHGGGSIQAFGNGSLPMVRSLTT